MSAARARFVTVCQQLLALGVVVVALVPATRVVSLDVVGVRPDGVQRPALRVGELPLVERARVSVRVVERGSGGPAARHALGGRDRLQAIGTGP